MHRIPYIKYRLGGIMENCSQLYILSTLACQLAGCLEEKELEILATDLIVLGEMLENILARK